MTELKFLCELSFLTSAR